MSYTTCQTKVHFDTNFEAERAASITSHRYGDEMMAYRCQQHYHITHVDPDKRLGYGHRFKKCDDCGEVYRLDQAKRHYCEDLT